MRIKNTKKKPLVVYRKINLLVILFFTALVVLGLIIKTKIEIPRYSNKTQTENLPPKLHEDRVALNPDIPRRKIHLSWDKFDNYDVVFDMNDFLLYAKKEAGRQCSSDMIQYGQCDKAMRCLQLLSDSLVANDILEKEFKEKFSVINLPNCVYEDNKNMTLQEYWFFGYGIINSGDPRMTIINIKTGKSLDYYVDKYVRSCVSEEHDYYDPDGNWMFSKSVWAECYP